MSLHSLKVIVHIIAVENAKSQCYPKRVCERKTVSSTEDKHY